MAIAAKAFVRACVSRWPCYKVGLQSAATTEFSGYIGVLTVGSSGEHARFGRFTVIIVGAVAVHVDPVAFESLHFVTVSTSDGDIWLMRFEK